MVLQPCPGVRYVPVRATINAEHAFVIGGVVSDKAGKADVAIPISFQHDSPTPEIMGARALIHVRIDSRLYVPTGCSKGAIVSQSVDPSTKMRAIVLDVDGINITRQPSVCTNILGSTMLAPFDTTAVIIDSVEWIQISRTPRITRIPGTLVVQAICYPGSRPIMLIDGPIVRVRPMPASTDVTIEVDSGAGVLESVFIYDVHGRMIVKSREGSAIDIRMLPDGVYTIVAETTAGQWIGPLVIRADQN
jgi:hypothetical protein